MEHMKKEIHWGIIKIGGSHNDSKNCRFLDCGLWIGHSYKILKNQITINDIEDDIYKTNNFSAFIEFGNKYHKLLEKLENMIQLYDSKSQIQNQYSLALRYCSNTIP